MSIFLHECNLIILMFNLKFLTNLYTCDSVGDSFVAEKYLYAGYNNLLKFTTDIL